jgi:hypothetical protein
MPDFRLSGLGMTFLMGGVLILLFAGLTLAFVPVFRCPECNGAHQLESWEAHGSEVFKCAYCKGEKRVTLRNL